MLAKNSEWKNQIIGSEYFTPFKPNSSKKQPVSTQKTKKEAEISSVRLAQVRNPRRNDGFMKKFLEVTPSEKSSGFGKETVSLSRSDSGQKNVGFGTERLREEKREIVVGDSKKEARFLQKSGSKLSIEKLNGSLTDRGMAYASRVTIESGDEGLSSNLGKSGSLERKKLKSLQKSTQRSGNFNGKNKRGGFGPSSRNLQESIDRFPDSPSLLHYNNDYYSEKSMEFSRPNLKKIESPINKAFFGTKNKDYFSQNFVRTSQKNKQKTMPALQNSQKTPKTAKEILRNFKTNQMEFIQQHQFEKHRDLALKRNEMKSHWDETSKEFQAYLGKSVDLLKEMKRITNLKSLDRSLFNTTSTELLDHLRNAKGSFLPFLYYLFILGKMFIVLHETNKGIMVFLLVKRICKGNRLHHFQMKVCREMASAYQQCKKYEMAIKSIGKMLKLSWLTKNRQYESLAYDMLGIQYYYLDSMRKSQGYHTQMIEGWFEPDDSSTKTIVVKNLKNEIKCLAKPTPVAEMCELLPSLLMEGDSRFLIGTIEDSFYDDIDDLLVNIESRFDLADAKRQISFKDHSTTWRNGDISKGTRSKEHLTEDERDSYVAQTTWGAIGPDKQKILNQKLRILRKQRMSEFHFKMNQILNIKTKAKPELTPCIASFTESGLANFPINNFKFTHGEYSNFKFSGEKDSRITIALEKQTNDTEALLTHLSACKQLENFMNNYDSRVQNEGGSDKMAIEFSKAINFSDPIKLGVVASLIQKTIDVFEAVADALQRNIPIPT